MRLGGNFILLADNLIIIGTKRGALFCFSSFRYLSFSKRPAVLNPSFATATAPSRLLGGGRYGRR
jgi:hypothetical protein